MSAVVLPSQYQRMVVRCHCGLTQFATQAGICRKCSAEYEDADEPVDLKLLPVPLLDGVVVEEDGIVTIKPVGAVDMAFAIKTLRKALNLSQTQLAARLQVPRTYISKIENKGVCPIIKHLPRMAKALCVSERDLVALATIQ